MFSFFRRSLTGKLRQESPSIVRSDPESLHESRRHRRGGSSFRASHRIWADHNRSYLPSHNAPNITVCLLFALLVAGALPVAGAPLLFPKRIHLSREIVDPISGVTARIEEYYFANRTVTIRGERTVIADYDSQELTEIDRANATFSVTSLADLAAASSPRIATQAGASAGERITVQRKGSDRRAGRDVDVLDAVDNATALHAEIAVDLAIGLSRDAFDVVTGAAHPGAGGPVSDLARAAARRSGVLAQSTGALPAESYGLPLELNLRWVEAGRTIEMDNRVVRVGDEAVPPDLLAVPPGAHRVDSHRIRVKRASDQVDGITPLKSLP